MAASLTLIALVGALLFSLINFLPMYIQGVVGESTATAGYVVTIIALGTFAGALFSGFTLNRIGFRAMCFAGALLTLGGLMCLVLAMSQSQVGAIVLINGVLGFGLAMIANATIVAIQALAPAEELGAASSLFHFLRMLGGTLGIALLGGIQLGVFHSTIESSALHIDLSMMQVMTSPQNLFDPILRAQFNSETLRALASAMQTSLQAVFGVAAVLAVSMLLFTLWMPKRNPVELKENST